MVELMLEHKMLQQFKNNFTITTKLNNNINAYKDNDNNDVLTRKAHEIYEKFKEIFDEDSKLHGSYVNGTFNEASDVDIMTASLQKIQNKLKNQNKFYL